jgi:hypothetical protein
LLDTEKYTHNKGKNGNSPLEKGEIGGCKVVKGEESKATTPSTPFVKPEVGALSRGILQQLPGECRVQRDLWVTISSREGSNYSLKMRRNLTSVAGCGTYCMQEDT